MLKQMPREFDQLAPSNSAGNPAKREDTQVKPTSASRTEMLITALFLLLPATLFYTILLRKAVNIPNLDDYDTLLGFLNQWVQCKGIAAKVTWFLASQNSEFKLFFLHGIACLQHGLSGHINFKTLGAIANGLILLLAVLLWKMFLPTHENLATRMALFIPVPWLIFQLQYWDDLNWATPGLQHVAVLVFSFATIWLLVQGKGPQFYGALACFILAIFSDGNGLLMIPIGSLILISSRRYIYMAGWLVASTGCVAVYAYHYSAILSPTGVHRSVFSVVLQLRPDYVLCCIGGAVGLIFPSGAASFLLGILLCAFFVWMAYRGYIRRNPAVSCCVLFLLLTTVGVAGLRSDLGVAQSLTSRYTIYSALFLVFAWVAIVEEFLQHKRVPLLNNGIFLGAVTAAVLFSLIMDLAGATVIEERNRRLVQAMAEFEHPTMQQPEPLPSPPYSVPGPHGESEELPLRARFRALLIQSMDLGVYRPPSL